MLAPCLDIFRHGLSGFTGFYGALETGRRFHENANGGLGDIGLEQKIMKETINA